jgi:diacylglycerol kinase
VDQRSRFRQEGVAAIIAVIIACFLDVDAITRVLLIGSVLLVMIVEILNSAIEAVVDRIGSDFHELSGRAKDMGSAAVLLAIITASSPGSRCFGHISDEPRGIIKSLVFVQFLVPKSPLTVYTHSITVYTPRGRNESVNDQAARGV